MPHSQALALLAAACLVPIACNSSPTVPARVEGGIDYADWPAVTDKPFEVAEHVFAFCEPPREMKTRGPHFVPAIRVYANPTALAAIRGDDTKPMPVDSVVVKEKWQNKQDARPTGYAAMVKREPGYDPDNGDWEYVYVWMSPDQKVQRGRTESCIACHRTVAKQDYLFRTYLKPEAEK